MRGFSCIFITLLLTAGAAEAQPVIADPPRWDLNLNIGVFGAEPGERDYPYHDWYADGRYAASIGYFWTEHLKTEFEFAHSGEGSRYIIDYARVPGTGSVHTFSVQGLHRIQQASARVGWQFGHNTWVHPYLNAGYVLDIERRRYHSDVQYVILPGARVPIMVQPEIMREGGYVYRHGVSIGAGSKFYVSSNAYINSGVQWTYAKPAKTLTALVGFGVEF